MFTSLYVNRRRGYSILRKARPVTKRQVSLLSDSSEEDEWVGRGAGSPLSEVSDDSSSNLLDICKRDCDSRRSKRRKYGGLVIRTPNSSRFANHLHSRILQRFPFLVEMFYWALNYLFYACTKAIAQSLSPPDVGVVRLAQQHGIWVLKVEQTASIIRWFYPIRELDFQNFVLTRSPALMTFFNRIYSLVHIPATIAFLSWYYYVAPNHRSFSAVRRTMTMGNFAAFLTFCLWPCMPPRLLPESFGFHDTVRQEHAESVWVGGKNVNQLAAMPSLHFTYAFSIGCTFLWHSGIIQRVFVSPRERRPLAWTDFLLVALAVLYPMLVVSVIVATANHYWMDAMVAIFTTALSFLCNRAWNVLLPLEDLLLWAWRLEKPTPTTGDRARGRRIAYPDIEYSAMA